MNTQLLYFQTDRSASSVGAGRTAATQNSCPYLIPIHSMTFLVDLEGPKQVPTAHLHFRHFCDQNVR